MPPHTQALCHAPSYPGSLPRPLIPRLSATPPHTQALCHAPSYPGSLPCPLIPRLSATPPHTQALCHAPSYPGSLPRPLIPRLSATPPYTQALCHANSYPGCHTPLSRPLIPRLSRPHPQCFWTVTLFHTITYLMEDTLGSPGTKRKQDESYSCTSLVAQPNTASRLIPRPILHC